MYYISSLTFAQKQWIEPFLVFESVSCSKQFSLSYFYYFQIVQEENFKTFLHYLPGRGLHIVDIAHALEMIKSGVVFNTSLLEHDRRMGKSPACFSLGMGDWKEFSDKDELDDLLIKAAESVDPDPAVGSRDDDIDSILLDVSDQFDLVLPHTKKGQK